MARAERESDRRSGRHVGAAETSRACRMAQASAEKLEHTGPADKEREQLESALEPLLPKGKGTEPSV